MGIFFTSSKPVVPAIQTALHEAFLAVPNPQTAPQQAAQRTTALVEDTSPQFKPWRFAGAMLIAAALLVTALWADKQHAEIAKTLMTSFTSFMGIVLGVLGGEAQKSTSG